MDPVLDSKKKYGIWPFTVWEADNPDDHKTSISMKEAVGDTITTSTRRGCGDAFSGKTRRQMGGVSIFNPAYAAWILNLYGPKQGLCFDPFAGGGTRAVFAAKHGLGYLGVELRNEECLEVTKRCRDLGLKAWKQSPAEELKIPGAGEVAMVCHDSRTVNFVPDACADFCMTCPPYWNLEKYNGGENDLSMTSTYEQFDAMLSECIWQTSRILKPGAASVWVVGLHRTEEGELTPMNHDVARAHKNMGFWFKEEIIIYRKNSGAGQRVANFEKGRRFLARCHEYALVFVKKEGK